MPQKTRHMIIPNTPRMNIIIPAPEPLPEPNMVTIILSVGIRSMNGSQITSTIQPPKKYPMGIVKNWSVFRQAYTLPCISAGIVDLTITSMLVLINGTGNIRVSVQYTM